MVEYNYLIPSYKLSYKKEGVKDMIIETLGQVTFVNGILRVQALGVAPSGEVVETGTIEIPGNKVGDIINLLAGAAQNISDKIGEEPAASKEGNGKKDKKDNKKKK